jgi:hypothetical protein
MDEGFAWETRKIRKGMIPYLKDAKRRGHRSFLKKDNLIVNGQACFEWQVNNSEFESWASKLNEQLSKMGLGYIFGMT